MPPAAGPLEPLLDDVPVAALDLSRTNRQPCCPRTRVVQLVAPPAQVAVGRPHGRFGLPLRFEVRSQGPQHGGHLVLQQPVCLPTPPGFGPTGTDRYRRRAELFTDVPEVQQVTALPAKLFLKLGGDPPGAVAHAMHAGVRSQPGGTRGLAPELSGHVHAARVAP